MHTINKKKGDGLASFCVNKINANIAPNSNAVKENVSNVNVNNA